MSPPDNGRVRVMRLNKVVLPDPLGPIRPTISCSDTVKLTFSTAVTPPKCLLACLTSSMDQPLSGCLRVEGLPPPPIGSYFLYCGWG